jgi:hypothetical protein
MGSLGVMISDVHRKGSSGRLRMLMTATGNRVVRVKIEKTEARGRIFRAILGRTRVYIKVLKAAKIGLAKVVDGVVRRMVWDLVPIEGYGVEINRFGNRAMALIGHDGRMRLAMIGKVVETEQIPIARKSVVAVLAVVAVGNNF